MKYNLIAPVFKLRRTVTATQSLIGGSLLLLGSTASADVIYNNLGAGGTFDTTAAVDVTSTQYPAISFTVAPGHDFEFESISLGLQGTGGITLSLDLDNGGAPGSVLTSMQATVNSKKLYTLSDSSGLTLLGGQTYWITASPGPSENVSWNLSTQTGLTSLISSDDQGSTWSGFPSYQQLSLEVQGTVVPEPASCAIIGLGLIGMFYLAPRRKN